MSSPLRSGLLGALVAALVIVPAVAMLKKRQYHGVDRAVVRYESKLKAACPPLSVQAFRAAAEGARSERKVRDAFARQAAACVAGQYDNRGR